MRSLTNDKEELEKNWKMEKKTVGHISLFGKVNEITIENCEISVKETCQKSD